MSGNSELQTGTSFSLPAGNNHNNVEYPRHQHRLKAATAISSKIISPRRQIGNKTTVSTLQICVRTVQSTAKRTKKLKAKYVKCLCRAVSCLDMAATVSDLSSSAMLKPRPINGSA